MRRNIRLLLLAADEHLRRPFRRLIRQSGLTEQQWRIIRMLNERREMGIVDLADECYLLRPSIVGIIARMEELDLLRRRPDESDGRRATIRLTARGQALADRMIPHFAATYAQLETILGKSKFDQLYLMLDDVIAHLSASEEWQSFNLTDPALAQKKTPTRSKAKAATKTDQPSP